MFANLAAMHRFVAERQGQRTALRYKRDGWYHDLSWSDYRRQADHAAAGLVSLGIEPGDRVAILSENRREWLIADIAILAAAAVNVPLHAPLTAPQVQYQLEHSDARGVIVSNAAQAAKVRSILDQLPNLEFVISLEPIAPLEPVRQLTWSGLIQMGQQAPAAQAKARRREAALASDDLATIIYTSGTTGNPKGVMLSHGNFLTNADAMTGIAQLKPSDVLLSWLPYSHVYARTVDHYLTILSQSTVCLAESADTLLTNLAEIQPTWMTAVPRFYEKIWSIVEPLGAGERQAALQRIFGPNIHWLSSGGAPLPGHVCAGFWEAGFQLLEGYGLTESSPVITFNRQTHFKIGSVGQVVPGVEVDIAEDGEILTRGPHVMQGYWKNPDATAQTIVDGWLRTGDVGSLDDDGFLTITDRKKDLIVTSCGKNIAPSILERLLVSDPYIDQAVLYGDRRPFVAALIVPNLESLRKVAQERGCNLAVDGDFIESEPLRSFIAKRIETVMESVSGPERVKQFLLLARPLSAEQGEMTATMKVRRREIVRKFEERLDRLYSQPHYLATDETQMKHG